MKRKTKRGINTESPDFKLGYATCEARVRKELLGRDSSELWGEHGLIAASMRCVMSLQVEDITYLRGIIVGGDSEARTVTVRLKELPTVILGHEVKIGFNI